MLLPLLASVTILKHFRLQNVHYFTPIVLQFTSYCVHIVLPESWLGMDFLIVAARGHYGPVGVFHLRNNLVVSWVFGRLHFVFPRMKLLFVSVFDLDRLQILLNLISLCPQSALTAKGPWSVWSTLVIPGQMLAQHHLWARHQKALFHHEPMTRHNSRDFIFSYVAPISEDSFFTSFETSNSLKEFC